MPHGELVKDMRSRVHVEYLRRCELRAGEEEEEEEKTQCRLLYQ